MGTLPMMAQVEPGVAESDVVGEALAMALVSVERADAHVSVVTLDNPSRLNSLSFALVGDLYAALEEVAADGQCRVVVLTGAGRAFCSGLELEHAGLPPGAEELGRHRMGMRAMSFMGGIVPAMRAIPQPIIAAIRGPAFGGGMCLSLGADIRLAGRSATFCGAGINNGLSGTELGVSWLLPRAVGTSHAAEMLLTGKRVDAEEALRIGLVSRVIDDEHVMEAAVEMAVAMCRFSPFGLALTKETMWASLEVGSLGAAVDLENRTQLLAGHTGNLDEASAAFREKRPPVYTE
jgi:enoyl-CoA hydratase